MRLQRLLILTSSMVTLAGPLSACGDGTEQARSAEDLAAALVTVDDLEGDWEVNLGPDDAAMDESGVVPEEARPLLPSIELCEEASAESRSLRERFDLLKNAVGPDDPEVLEARELAREAACRAGYSMVELGGIEPPSISP